MHNHNPSGDSERSEVLTLSDIWRPARWGEKYGFFSIITKEAAKKTAHPPTHSLPHSLPCFSKISRKTIKEREPDTYNNPRAAAGNPNYRKRKEVERDSLIPLLSFQYSLLRGEKAFSISTCRCRKHRAGNGPAILRFAQFCKAKHDIV